MRRWARIAAASLFLTVAWAASAAAQTGTTTIPPVREIPVTGGQTTTTTAPASTSGTSGTSGGGLASTGVAADVLVPFGVALIGVGGVLQVAARRPRRDLGLL